MEVLKSSAPYFPFLLVFLYFYSKIKGREVSGFYPAILSGEFIFWELWFLITLNEMAGFIANIIIYAAITWYLLKTNPNKYAKHFSTLYIFSSIVVLYNIAYLAGWRGNLTTWFWGYYSEILTIVMMLMTTLGLVGMYNGGNTGKRRINNKRKLNNKRKALLYGLAGVESRKG